MTRKILLTMMVATAGLIVTSCGSAKFQAYVPEDKALFAAINELNKHPDNQQAQNDLRAYYEQAVVRHEEAIDIYRNSNDDRRWDKMLTELNALQHIYTSLQAVPGAFAVIKPVNYLKELVAVKEEAAAYYYAAGTQLLASDGSRESGLQAYEAFKKAGKYVPGYKGIEKQQQEAYEQGIVNVVINPVEDDNLFYTGIGVTDLRYRPQDYQESLVRELGGSNANIVPARFYTDRDARRESIEPDRIVDVSWRNIDARPSVPYQYNRQVSRSVQTGTDTSGKPIYTTVRATLHITQRTFNVQGALDYRISDLVSNNYVDQGLLTDQVSWTDSYATYTGDSRALTQEEWYLVNNRNGYNMPSRSVVLNSLMRKLYPDLRRRIQQSVYN